MENQYAPPGYFAPAAPKPSKAAVMIFYVSVAFCIIGMIMIVKGVLKPNLKVLSQIGVLKDSLQLDLV